MKILVQTHRRQHSQLEDEYRQIEKAGYEAVSYGYIEQDNGDIKIVGLEHLAKDEPVFNRASIQILRMHFVEKRKFIGEFPDRFLTSIEYDVSKFKTSKMPSSPCMINTYPGMHKYVKLKDVLHVVNKVDTFYKPDDDRKLINGTIVPKGKCLIDVLDIKLFNDRQLNEYLLQSVNVVKDIKEEIRCFVVDSKVVTAARYRRNGKYDTTPLTGLEESFYLSYANIYINDLYSPGNMFTIDLALHNEQISIMEYNCLNTSGMYEINSKRLFDTINKKMYLQ